MSGQEKMHNLMKEVVVLWFYFGTHWQLSDIGTVLEAPMQSASPGFSRLHTPTDQQTWDPFPWEEFQQKAANYMYVSLYLTPLLV